MASEPIRVLLVEDEKHDSQVTRAALAECGADHFKLLPVANEAAGLEAMRHNRADVYLIAAHLKEWTGLQLLRAGIAAGCRGPILLLTERSDRALDTTAIQAGAADCLVKRCLDAAALERAIHFALERHRVAEALRKAHDELETHVAQRTAALSEANARLADADRRKDEFLAILAHELRNPLAPLLSGLHLLRETGPCTGIHGQALDTAERQVRHLARMVDDLLDVSRITRGVVQLRNERLDLSRLVRTAVEDSRRWLRSEGRTLEVQTPELPLWVLGDATRLTQIVNNLLDNAAKFSKRDSTIDVAVYALEPGRQAVLAVRDSGVGIEASLLPHLFDCFAQADKSLARTAGGLGLGLAVVKGLAELHGGSVAATSEGVGRGAQFTVYLPLQPEPAALSGTPAAPAAPCGSKKGLRVVVIEDNRDAADMLCMLLQVLGHETRVAYTGPEGVQLATSWPLDIVLSDIGLPGLDGYEVARRLRRHPATSRARLIALTGYSGEEDRRRSREAGFDFHVVKPVDPASLEQLLVKA